MSEILQANIFFMITAFAVIVVTVMVMVALYYVIKILRAIRDIAERVREGSEVIADDVANVREGIVSGRFFRTVFDRAQAAAGFGAKRPKRRARKDEQNAETEEESINDTSDEI